MSIIDLDKVSKEIEKFAQIQTIFSMVKEGGHLSCIFHSVERICETLGASSDRRIKDVLKIIIGSVIDEAFLKQEKEKVV